MEDGMEDRKVELLSPAGSEEGFYGAIHAGADAVYLAGEKFGARAYAENFTRVSLVECIRYAHLLKRKVYLTVNTLLKENELAGLYEYLLPYYEAGLDAVIVQDLGVFRFVREHFPGLKLHVSTQMTLCAGFGASLLKEMGASRIVPARELELGELKAMKQEADIEIETFIHGAMCYCYSGQCLFSSILGGRSGNRGRCAQPCRLPYRVSTGDGFGKECYPLSLKDMCTIEHIPELMEAGIDSFKIEGRMKKPEYTAGVTEVYRYYIDQYYELREQTGTEEAQQAYRVNKADLERIKSLYIRSGIQNGYYFRHSGREMITLDSPAYNENNDKILTEIRQKHLAGKAKLPIHVKASFHVGYPAEVTFSCQDKCCRVTGDMVERAGKQPVTRENIERQLGKLGDSAFRAAEMEIAADQDCFYPLKRINELRRAAVAGLEEQILAPDLVRQQEKREPGDQEVLLPMCEKSQHMGGAEGEQQKSHVISVVTLPQLEAVAEWFSRERADRPLRFYIEGDLFLQKREKVEALCRRMSGESTFFLALPYILRKTDQPCLERMLSAMQENGIFQGFLARSMDGLGFVREMRRYLPWGGELSETVQSRRGEETAEKEKVMPPACRTDAGVYLWNRQAGQELSSLAEGFCLPWELNGSGQRALAEGLPCEKIVYGRIPMMITANCLLRTLGRCQNFRMNGRRREAGDSGNAAQRKDHPYTVFEDRYHAILKDRYHAILKDRYRSEFPVVANCLHCINIIYNSVPFSLYQQRSVWEGRADLRMDFTLETPEEVKALLYAFLKGAPFPFQDYTTGHEKRGAE